MSHELRASEALPPADVPITDRDIVAECPTCAGRFRLFDVPTRFQSSQTTYTCPSDGAVIVKVVAAKGQATLHTAAGLWVDLRGDEAE